MSRIEAQRNILDFTLSSLLRRKRKNAALILVYTLVVFLIASVMFFTHAIRKEASLVLKDAPEMVVQKLVAGRQDLMPLDYIEKIKGIKGISSIKGRLWGYYFDPFFGANYTLMSPDDDRLPSGTIAIGEGIAKDRKVHAGDMVALNAYNGETMLFKVQEIFSAESALVSADLVLMSIDDLRNLFNWRGGVIIVILFVAVISFFIFAWDRASGLGAEEKREIGILKAIGWETSDVILMKFWEGMVISFSSFLLGVLLAYAHVYFTSSLLFEPVLKGWSVIYPDFKLIPFIDAYQISTLFFLTVLPYTVSTIVPSWRAATIDPDLVMRT